MSLVGDESKGIVAVCFDEDTVSVTAMADLPRRGRQRWRRWESKTSSFAPIQATTGNHRKPDPELAETGDEKKHVRENALPTGKIGTETAQGRADVGETPTAETLGMLARKVLSSSRHADSRRLARAVLRLLARQ